MLKRKNPSVFIGGAISHQVLDLERLFQFFQKVLDLIALTGNGL